MIKCVWNWQANVSSLQSLLFKDIIDILGQMILYGGVLSDAL